MKEVVRFKPFQRACDLEVKPLPVTFTVSELPLIFADLGLNELTLGDGFSLAVVMTPVSSSVSGSL